MSKGGGGVSIQHYKLAPALEPIGGEVEMLRSRAYGGSVCGSIRDVVLLFAFLSCLFRMFSLDLLVNRGFHCCCSRCALGLSDCSKNNFKLRFFLRTPRLLAFISFKTTPGALHVHYAERQPPPCKTYTRSLSLFALKTATRSNPTVITQRSVYPTT